MFNNNTRDIYKRPPPPLIQVTMHRRRRIELRSTYRGLRLVLGDGGESNSMDWLGKYLQMMQVLPGRRRREPVVGSSWDIFTMDAGSVWETDEGSRLPRRPSSPTRSLKRLGVGCCGLATQQQHWPSACHTILLKVCRCRVSQPECLPESRQ